MECERKKKPRGPSAESKTSGRGKEGQRETDSQTDKKGRGGQQRLERRRETAEQEIRPTACARALLRIVQGESLEGCGVGF
jgi:hypothetical protein